MINKITIGALSFLAIDWKRACNWFEKSDKNQFIPAGVFLGTLTSFCGREVGDGWVLKWF